MYTSFFSASRMDIHPGGRISLPHASTRSDGYGPLLFARHQSLLEILDVIYLFLFMSDSFLCFDILRFWHIELSPLTNIHNRIDIGALV